MGELSRLNSLFNSLFQLEAVVGVVSLFFMELTELRGVLIFSTFGERPGRSKVLLDFFRCQDLLRGFGEGSETHAFISARRVSSFNPSRV
ncbi:hypothetical protein Hanom_Chr02g00147031 [Helianthus anomalus]